MDFVCLSRCWLISLASIVTRGQKLQIRTVIHLVEDNHGFSQATWVEPHLMHRGIGRLFNTMVGEYLLYRNNSTSQKNEL
ncbi:hypothetical protein BKA56DRAFT_572768 [Ilyonectria sp. MPI-CAGE-AT-0026]|nr:hypothetical protein BKA56DRAFT_572768 [Ilyonectria sp. MPI-CAGE-AT-0026]